MRAARASPQRRLLMKKKSIRNIEYELLFGGEKELPSPEESIEKIRAYAKDDA